jgi:pantoate--beta-alanine ligase
MEIITSIAEIRKAVHRHRSSGGTIGFVPTMGALHNGHLSLLAQSKANASLTIVSIFVNPTQFGPNEDFERYPRPVEEDIALLKHHGADILFLPSTEEMYTRDRYFHFEIIGMADNLCGKTRPGHFQGVVQVVNKLFNIVRPDVAVFGLKDIQQYRIIERMAEEFNHPVTILPGVTVREPDGLAMSSRNRYLTAEQRTQAPLLYQCLRSVFEMAASLNIEKTNAVIAACKQDLIRNGFKIDYLDLVEYGSLQPVEFLRANARFIIAGAVFVGKTRLIDNLILET